MGADIRSLVGRLLDAQSDELPYLVHGDHVMSRAEVRTAVDWEAGVFLGHGVREGHTVMLQVPPSYTHIEGLLALWQLGAQVMLVDHRLKESEVRTLRSVCRPQFMVTTGRPGTSPLGFQPRYELITTRIPDGRAASTEHRLLQFSSGSTGVPKVIGRTAASLSAEIERFTGIEGMPVSGERVLLLSSMAHSFGLIAGLLHSLVAGVTVAGVPVAVGDVAGTAVASGAVSCAAVAC